MCAVVFRLAKTKKLHGLACKESRRVLEEEVYETLGLGLPGCAASRCKPSPNVSIGEVKGRLRETKSR